MFFSNVLFSNQIAPLALKFWEDHKVDNLKKLGVEISQIQIYIHNWYFGFKLVFNVEN